jgi:hypothetical protein
MLTVPVLDLARPDAELTCPVQQQTQVIDAHGCRHLHRFAAVSPPPSEAPSWFRHSGLCRRSPELATGRS